MEHAQAVARGLRDIGRAGRESGVPPKMIRHYEAIGLLAKVARTFANYRVYTDNDLHALRFIKRARALGFSMADIKELLGLWQNELKSIADTLDHLARHCHGDHRPECPILDDLAA